MNKNILRILGLVVLIIALGAVYVIAKPKPTEGAKNVTIEVIDHNAESTVYKVDTDADYLRGAMDDAVGLSFSGVESVYGLMVLTVNGLTADYEKDASYWAFYINDDYAQYGVDEQVVNHGDNFRIEYTIDNHEGFKE